LAFNQHCLILIHAKNQVTEDEELLDTARDCLHFVTKFFEPINLSATHIYHSALEISPLQSTIRKLYYHQRHSQFPRVVAGTPGSWNQSVKISASGGFSYRYFDWSPCGQLFAASYGKTIGIWDPLSSELLSTFTKSGTYSIDELSYSPDGHSLASLSNTALIIWDIQTGGVASEIAYSSTYKNELLLVWSLDGQTIGTIFQLPLDTTLWIPYTAASYGIHVYDVASGIKRSPGILQSRNEPYLWGHGKSFQIMTTEWDNKAFVINIFEVGSILTKIKSFNIKLLDSLVGSLCSHVWGESPGIKSFSPATYRVSALVHNQLQILDIQNSECLLEQNGDFKSHCYSSDGNLFVASLLNTVHIWKHTSSHYIPWRQFPTQNSGGFCLKFSPTSSSILRDSWDSLQVWHLDGPLIVTHCDSHRPLAILAHCGAYMVTGCEGDSTITIINPLSQTPLQLINTGIKIEGLTLTGNILLVLGSGMIAAWLLTEEGMVDSVLAKRIADKNSSIWAVSSCDFPMFFARDQVMIMDWERRVHVYHTGTGEILKPLQEPPHHQYVSGSVQYGQHYPHYLGLDMYIPKEGWPISFITLHEGWVKDPEGKHQLWIPVEWRSPMLDSTGWLSNLKTLWLNCRGKAIIIMF